MDSAENLRMMTSNLPLGFLGSVASLLAGILYQGKSDRKHKPCNIVSTDNCLLHMRNVTAINRTFAIENKRQRKPKGQSRMENPRRRQA